MPAVEVMHTIPWQAAACPGDAVVSMTLDAVDSRRPYVVLRLAVLPDEDVAAYRARLQRLVTAGKLAPGAAGIGIETGRGERGAEYAGRRWNRAGVLADGTTIVCDIGGDEGKAFRREAAEALCRAGWSVALDDQHLPADGALMFVKSGPMQGEPVKVEGTPYAGRIGVRTAGGGSAQIGVEQLSTRKVERQGVRTRRQRPGTRLNVAIAQMIARPLRARGYQVEEKADGTVEVVQRDATGAVVDRIDSWDPDAGTDAVVRSRRSGGKRATL